MKKNIAFVIVLVCLSVLLITGLKQIAAPDNVLGQDEINQAIAPTKGGDPGPVDNRFTYQDYLEVGSIF